MECSSYVMRYQEQPINRLACRQVANRRRARWRSLCWWIARAHTLTDMCAAHDTLSPLPKIPLRPAGHQARTPSPLINAHQKWEIRAKRRKETPSALKLKKTKLKLCESRTEGKLLYDISSSDLDGKQSVFDYKAWTKKVPVSRPVWHREGLVGPWGWGDVWHLRPSNKVTSENFVRLKNAIDTRALRPFVKVTARPGGQALGEWFKQDLWSEFIMSRY